MVNGLAVLALVQAVTLGGRVQGGITVAPDTVRVGDPFVVTVRVRAPLGASIQFPAGPDSGRAVEPLDPVQVVTTGDSIAVDQTARYRLAAWRVGRFPITFDDVVVRQDIGTRRIEISNVTITVASVLPPDSANIDPKPQRAVFTFGLPWWVYVLAGLVAAAILTLVWWLWRRRRQVARVREPAIAIAEREFDRVDAIGLVAAGERARYVALMTEVLRDYLAAAVPEASISQTTNELAGAMRRAGIGTYARAAALLAEVDLVKFARRPLTAERATALGREIRSIATAVHQAVSGTDQTAQAA